MIKLIIVWSALVSLVFLVILVVSKPPGTGRDPRCDTAARYDAMREAYDQHKPDPCNGAKTWRP